MARLAELLNPSMVDPIKPAVGIRGDRFSRKWLLIECFHLLKFLVSGGNELISYEAFKRDPGGAALDEVTEGHLLHSMRATYNLVGPISINKVSIEFAKDHLESFDHVREPGIISTTVRSGWDLREIRGSWSRSVKAGGGIWGRNRFMVGMGWDCSIVGLNRGCRQRVGIRWWCSIVGLSGGCRQRVGIRW